MRIPVDPHPHRLEVTFVSANIIFLAAPTTKNTDPTRARVQLRMERPVKSQVHHNNYSLQLQLSLTRVMTQEVLIIIIDDLWSNYTTRHPLSQRNDTVSWEHRGGVVCANHDRELTGPERVITYVVFVVCEQKRTIGLGFSFTTVWNTNNIFRRPILNIEMFNLRASNK